MKAERCNSIRSHFENEFDFRVRAPVKKERDEKSTKRERNKK